MGRKMCEAEARGRGTGKERKEDGGREKEDGGGRPTAETGCVAELSEG